MTSFDRSAGRRHGRPKADRARPDHRRAALAAEAARIIHEQGLTDFRGAKTKALERLGLGRGTPLPDNEEIEAALAERNRVFYGDSQPGLLLALREAARCIMEDLHEFHPRLVGDVLSGNATMHSVVDLHLFSDAVETLTESLDAHGIPHRIVERRVRLRRETVEAFPGLRFSAYESDFRATVFPVRLRGQPPLSRIDGKPMHRGTLRELETLLGQRDPRST